MLSRLTLLRCVPLLALGALTLSGCAKAPAVVEPPPPKVTVQHPETRQLVDEDDYNGWLRPSAVVEVRARVRGHIQKIDFKDGDMVQANQLLIELDKRPFEIARDQAKAQMKAFEAQKLAAQADVARYSELIKTGGASKQQLEQAQAAADSFDAQIAAKLQEVAQAELDIEFSQITTPIAGRISRAQLTEGNLVNAGGSDSLLTTVVAIDPIYVYFSVDERSLQRYMKARAAAKDGDTPTTLRERKAPFRFGLDTDEGYPHQGLLDFADNQVDDDTGQIELRGVVDNKQGMFVPGSRVRVRVPVSEPQPALLVPDAAILTDQDKRYLLVLGGNNVVLRRDVTLGRLLDDGSRVVTSKDLKDTDWIIVLGLQRARVNYPVQPVDASGNSVDTGAATTAPQSPVASGA